MAAGRLVLLEPSGEARDIAITISTRGKSRLQVCSLPLLTLELSPETAGPTPFQGQRRIHLTTQCRRESRSRDDLVQEYLSYQAYRLLSEHALGVRPTSLEILDTEDKRRVRSSQAFLLEDLELAASRLGIEWLEPRTVETTAFEPEPLALLGLFQYMLGNTDWSVRAGASGEACCHNVAIFGSRGAESGLIPVPYDFDSTGLVDPEYAAPPKHLPIRQVRQRLYRGFCASNPYLPAAIERLAAARQELFALFDASPVLSSVGKRSTRKYLADFFDVLGDPASVESKILDACR